MCFLHPKSRTNFIANVVRDLTTNVRDFSAMNLQVSGVLRETQDSPRTKGTIACLLSATAASLLKVLPSHLLSARSHTRGFAEYRRHVPNEARTQINHPRLIRGMCAFGSNRSVSLLETRQMLIRNIDFPDRRA
jgi:hypothetical protein